MKIRRLNENEYEGDFHGGDYHARRERGQWILSTWRTKPGAKVSVKQEPEFVSEHADFQDVIDEVLAYEGDVSFGVVRAKIRAKRKVSRASVGTGRLEA